MPKTCVQPLRDEEGYPISSIIDPLRWAIVGKAKEMLLPKLAEEAGISTPAMYRFVKDRRPISLRNADALATFLGLKLQ